MGDQVLLDPALAPALSMAGLADVDGVLTLGSGDGRGDLPESVVAPIEFPLAGTSGRFHLKRYVYGGWRDSRGLLGRGTLLGQAPEIREFRVLAKLREAGVSAVRPVVACARTRRGRLIAHALLTEHVPDARDLARRLADPTDPVAHDASHRRRVLIHVAEQLAHMHAAELVHADAHTRNVLIGEGEDLHVTFLDCRRGGATTGTRSPLLDLATLDGDLEGVVPATDRLRALRAYLPAGTCPRRMVRRIAARRIRLRRRAERRRHRRQRS